MMFDMVSHPQELLSFLSLLSSPIVSLHTIYAVLQISLMQLFGKTGKLEAESLVGFRDKFFTKIFL